MTDCKQCGKEIARKTTEPWEEGFCDKCLEEGYLAQDQAIARDEEALETFFEGGD